MKVLRMWIPTASNDFQRPSDASVALSALCEDPQFLAATEKVCCQSGQTAAESICIYMA